MIIEYKSLSRCLQINWKIIEYNVNKYVLRNTMDIFFDYQDLNWI